MHLLTGADQNVKHVDRLTALRKRLEDEGVDAVIITAPDNRFYFSGFTGTAGVLFITADKNILVTDSRYVEQAAQQAPDFHVQKLYSRDDFFPLFHDLCEREKISRLGFEADVLTYNAWNNWTRHVKGIEMVPLQRIAVLRIVKDSQELEVMRRAAAIAERALEETMKLIKVGMTERAIAAELEYRMRVAGADKPSFDLIVASGPRSALPHGVASDRRLQAGDFVTIDFVCYYRGYASDETRTIVLGSADERQREIYEIVLAAQERALALIRPGVTVRAIDRAARDYIAERGYGEYFGHGLGHGLGINVHEVPTLGPSAEDIPLEPGMVITIEPGIYLPEWGGVRIEDAVIVTNDGYENLAGYTKKLLELPI